MVFTIKKPKKGSDNTHIFIKMFDNDKYKYTSLSITPSIDKSNNLNACTAIIKILLNKITFILTDKFIAPTLINLNKKATKVKIYKELIKYHKLKGSHPFSIENNKNSDKNNEINASKNNNADICLWKDFLKLKKNKIPHKIV